MIATMTPDQINGTFEVLGALFVLNHCRHVLRDGQVAGVSIASTVFFFAWGCWNIFYYPHLGQMWSLYGGVALAMANTFYIVLLVRFSMSPRVSPQIVR